MKSIYQVILILVFGWATVLLTGCESLGKPPEITLTFDGKSCVYDGPASIKEGEVTVTLENKSEYELSLWAFKIEDGKTWQEVLDYIGPPGSPVEPPDWSDSMLARDVPDKPNATLYTLKVGLYAICCCTCEEILGPRGVWPGASLEVKK